MTKLIKPIARRARCPHIWLRSGEVILTIYPEGVLGFREPRKRAEYRLGLTTAFNYAVHATLHKIETRVKELRKKDGLTLAQARRKARKELL